MVDADITDLLLEARHSTAHRLLAQRVVHTADGAVIEALVNALTDNVSLLRTNAAKVLSEVAACAPALLSPHVPKIADAVDVGTGVVVWEGMAVLATIAAIQPELIAPYLPVVQATMAGSSVIARDHGVRILVKLAGDPARHEAMMVPLLETLRTCPVNQLASYAEQVATIASSADTAAVRPVLEQRLADLPTGAKQRRVSAVLRKLG